MKLFGRTARLDALEIEVPLRMLESYHDDGYFESIETYCQHIGGRYLKDAGSAYNLIMGSHENRSPAAIFLQVYAKYRRNYHVACFDPNLDSRKITLAHEETHVLDRMGKLNLLSRKMNESAGVDINFDLLDDEEVIADIGSIYVADRLGLLESLECDGADSFPPAMYVYLGAKAK